HRHGWAGPLRDLEDLPAQDAAVLPVLELHRRPPESGDSTASLWTYRATVTSEGSPVAPPPGLSVCRGLALADPGGEVRHAWSAQPQWWKLCGAGSGGSGASSCERYSAAPRMSSINRSARSRSKPLRTTIRSAERSWRFSGKV